MIELAVDTVQWTVLGYFVVLNAGYLALNVLAFRELSRCMQTRALETLPQVYSGLEIPITLIVPAHNEAATIVASVRSLLQLNYPEFEVLVVNDGSRDRTLDVMRREFNLELVPEAFRVRVDCKPIRGVYRSRTHPSLRSSTRRTAAKLTLSTPASTAVVFRSSAVSMPTRYSSATACIGSCCPSSRTRAP